MTTPHSFNRNSSAALLAATAAYLSMFTLPGCDERPSPTGPSRLTTPSRPALDPRGEWQALKLPDNKGVELTPELVAKLRKGAAREPGGERRVLSGDDAPSAAVVLSMSMIASEHCAQINALKPSAVSALSKRRVDRQLFLRVIDDDVTTLLADTPYREALRTHLADKPIDCKEASTSLLLALLLRLNQVTTPSNEVSVRYVCGLLFHPEHSPQGVGHAWVEFDGKVLDWAIRTNDEMTRVPISTPDYIPIAWCELVYNTRTQQAKVTEFIGAAFKSESPTPAP
jgi:hypothetical protein